MVSKKQMQNHGVGLVLVSALLFGSYGVWSRLIGDTMQSFFQGWTRALIILILLVPIALFRKEIRKIPSSDWKWLMVFLVFTSLTQAPLFYAFNHMDVGTASMLFFVSMFLTMQGIGFLFLKEKMSWMKAISILLALGGMGLVFSFSLAKFTVLAALMAVVNGIASGGEVAFSKKLSNNLTPLYLIILSWGIILPTNGVLSVLLHESQTPFALSLPWFWQLCYSIASLFAFWFVVAGFKRIDASIGALLGLLEIVFSILFGVLFFGEGISLSVAIGGALIIGAAALPHVTALKRSSVFLVTE